jgi:hypothetical protein
VPGHQPAEVARGESGIDADLAQPEAQHLSKLLGG